MRACVDLSQATLGNAMAPIYRDRRLIFNLLTTHIENDVHYQVHLVVARFDGKRRPKARNGGHFKRKAERSMSGVRKARFYAANALGLACVAATCFLAACSDDNGGDGGPSSQAGSGGKPSGTAGKTGTSGAAQGGASAGAAQAGEANVAGADSDGGEPGMGDAGMGGAIDDGGAAGVGGSGAGTSGGAGTAGAGGAPIVALPNCTRDTTSGKVIAVSATGHDGLFGAAWGPDGNLYATGYVQDGVAATEDRSTVVVKILPTGVIDTTWASNGVAKVNVVATAANVPGQGEMPRGIAFQDGKIIVAGTVEASPTAVAPAGNDRNVYVLRLTALGALDPSFGDAATPGIHTLPLNTGTLVTNATTGAITLSGADAQWGLNVLPDKKLIVTAATRNSGFQGDGTTPRTDTDFALAKLTVDGLQDTTFGLNSSGIFTLDVAQASASVRTASVLPDGKLIVTGYSTYGGTQRPVIFKLTSAGLLDMSFGVFGAFTEPVGAAAEAYGAVLQSTGKLVTVGYGRATAATTATDLLSIRLTATGLLDTTYGPPTTPGRSWFDVGGYADNGRSLQVLSDDRPVLIGGGRLLADDQDGVIAILKADGTPDTASFGPFGCKAFDFGTIGDFLWGSALSANGNTIAAVGITGNAAGLSVDTDGTLVLLAKP
jgi:uncharacterized delta-60 repeat protein